jgi:hypothetical protein
MEIYSLKSIPPRFTLIKNIKKSTYTDTKILLNIIVKIRVNKADISLNSGLILLSLDLKAYKSIEKYPPC